MELIYPWILVASIVLFVIGIFSPKTSLFWYKGERTRMRSIISYGIVFIVTVILFRGSTKTDSQQLLNESENITSTAKEIGVGDVLKTNYFEIIVNSVNVENSVSTGNSFADLNAEEGSRYLILNTTFKNIDQESRMLSEGSIWINYNGKDYEFDKSETIMAEGWGLMFEQINPLTTYKTNIVYKIPNEIYGTAYWQPGRADANERILLGKID